MVRFEIPTALLAATAATAAVDAKAVEEEDPSLLSSSSSFGRKKTLGSVPPSIRTGGRRGNRSGGGDIGGTLRNDPSRDDKNELPGGVLRNDPSDSAAAVVIDIDVGVLKEDRREQRGLQNCYGDRPLIEADVNFAGLVRYCLSGDGDGGGDDDGPYGFFSCLDPIECWDTSRVTDMSYAFYYEDVFNKNIELWDTSSVTTMKWMFYHAFLFDKPLGDWNTSSVTDMEGMFYNTYKFNQDISSWDVSAVTSTKKMFEFAWVFDQALDPWNVSAVRNARSMFENAFRFNQPLDSWDVSGVLFMQEMFRGSDQNRDMDAWNPASVRSTKLMFSNMYFFDQCLSTWADKTPPDVYTKGMFGSTQCAVSTPDPRTGPWCQIPSGACQAPIPPCGNSPYGFGTTTNDDDAYTYSCADIASGTVDPTEVCADPLWSANCPGLCADDDDGECACVDFKGTFSVAGRGVSYEDVTCAALAKRPDFRIDQACGVFGLSGVCRGVCDDGC